METPEFIDWKRSAERTMKARYAIGLDDAGIMEDELVMHFRDGETAEGFVEWFACKYDLIDFNEVLVRRAKN